jgi:broad specificity phosphatase PhoE
MSDGLLRLILVRHGITAWNRDQRMQGHTDVGLDTEGIVQAARIAERLSTSGYPVQAIYSSDLQRARSTAKAIGAPLGLAVYCTPLLRETMMGEWEGLTSEEIVARGDEEMLSLYRRDPYINRPPGSEPMDQVWERMRRATELIRTEQSDGTVVVVGHGGSLRVLLCDALNASIKSMNHIHLFNAGMSIIEEVNLSDRRMQRVVLLNDTSHLA